MKFKMFMLNVGLALGILLIVFGIVGSVTTIMLRI